MDTETAIKEVMSRIETELRRAIDKYPTMYDYHHGWAVLYEEVDELWDEVKERHVNPLNIRAEAIQVGAMAARFILDLCSLEM